MMKKAGGEVADQLSTVRGARLGNVFVDARTYLPNKSCLGCVHG